MSSKQYKKLTCQDHTVSKEYFELLFDDNLEMFVTSPKPEESDLTKYYESDEYISHSNTKKSIIDKIYHLVRKYTIHQKIKLLDTFDKTYKTILDIGAGTGDFLLACKKNDWEIKGIEPNVKAKAIAIKKFQSSKANIYNTIEDLKTAVKKQHLKTFDVITMWHVLEHVPNLTEYISTLKQLLKPNGTLVIAVPNFKSYDAEHYKEFWAAYDVPRHLWHFSRIAIEKLFKAENMKVVNVLPMKFDSFYVSLLSEKYKTGSSNFLKAFYIGLQSNLKAKSTKEYSSLIYIIQNS